MKNFYISVTSSDWVNLKASLFTPDGHENAAVLLCGISDSVNETRLLVRRFVTVPDELYNTRASLQLEVSPHFYNQIITECLEENLSPVLIHSHPFSGDAWYSNADNYGESRLLSVFTSLLPKALPASLVVTETSVTGRRWDNEQFVPISGMKIFGPKTQIIEFSPKEEETTLPAQFDRQIRAFGELGQRAIQKLKVGVIGVGGIGSLVVEQLVRAGVTEFVMVDPDTIEESNISRIIGASLQDTNRSKVQVVGDHAKKLGAQNVTLITDSAIRQEILLSLRDRDIIFNCVDNDSSRAVLNRFSYQYLIPIVDFGTRLDARDGQVTAAAGRISIIGSGMTCLRCSHHLNPERIRAESMPIEERQSLQREGYIMGIDEPAPAVISINTVVAGLGVTAGLNMFVGLTGGEQPLGQIFDATTGSVFSTQPIHEKGCDICDENVGVKGLGDLQIVSAY